jgi:hypothetical protein
MPPRRIDRRSSPGQVMYELVAEGDTSSHTWVEWRDLSPADQARWEAAVPRFRQFLQEREAAEADEEPAPRRAPPLRVPPARPQP